MEQMPGIACNRALTTKRSLGTPEIRRSTRSTRNARSTASGPLAGISAMPTTMKSKTFQALRKKRQSKCEQLGADLQHEDGEDDVVEELERRPAGPSPWPRSRARA